MNNTPSENDLIFFYSHENCPARATAMPVLAWLAEKKHVDYDGYFCVRPSLADIGDAMPYTGNKHDEEFYYVANFFQHIYFLALTEETPIQFERFLQARGNSTIVKKASNNLVDFYIDIFRIFDEKLPAEAVVFSSEKFQFPNEGVDFGKFAITGESRLDTFCYPEVFFRKALAIHYELPDDQISRLISLGLKKVYLLFCPEEAVKRYKGMGLEVEVVDGIQADDSYASITGRIAYRWLDHAKGFSLGNDPITLRWTPKFLRERILPIAAVKSLHQAVDLLGDLTDRVGNKLIWGSQIYDDTIISDLSKRDIIFSLVHDVEVGITIKDKIQMPKSWLNDAPDPWDYECSDDYLKEQLDADKIPVCFVHYASDLGHLPVLARHLDMHSIDGIVDGFAFPATYWQYAEEQLEQLYISKEMGGIFPSSEPLLSSAGMGVATEAEEYLSHKALLSNLQKAVQIIEEHAGSKHIPLGYYPFQDACPKYKHGTGEPPFEVIADAGFEYMITYKHENKFPEIVYSKENFLALNQQVEHWSFNPLSDLKSWENKIIESQKKGWIILGLDSPFWGMVPCYFGIASKGMSLHELQKVMTYARDGGDSGKLFIVKPHEIVRFVRLMQKEGSV
ncbi:MAG: hypothetical protein GYA45_03800 [Pelolinea sp.]|jgi:hypothetical protein|nr:hypothetical protein [Pelolinea sp.]